MDKMNHFFDKALKDEDAEPYQDLSKSRQCMNKSFFSEFADYPFPDCKTEDLSQNSMFLQTLNLKSKAMSDQYSVSTKEGIGVRDDNNTQPASTQNNVNADSSGHMNAYFCMNNSPTAAIADTDQHQGYSNFLTEDARPSENDFKTEPETNTESDSQNSLGKTLATSLHLIASTDAHTLMPPVETSLADTVVLNEPQQTATEPSGHCSNDSVSSTTQEAEDTPPPTRYRTRSIAVSEKGMTVKDESQSPDDSNSDQREEGISSTETESLYPCDQCGKMFHKKQTLRQHFITHTDRFACNYCDVRCKSKGDLRSHTQTHTKEKPFHCEVCNTYYTRESILRKHKTTQLHKSECLKVERKRLLSKKRASEHNDRPQKSSNLKKTKQRVCNSCKKVCSSRSELKKHAKRHSLTLSCSRCYKRCKTAALLKVHERCHSKPTTLLCKLCSRSFSSQHILKEHVKDHYRLTTKAIRVAVREQPVIEKPVEEIKTSKGRPGKKPKKEQELMICQTCSRQFKSPKAFEKHCAKHVTPTAEKTSSKDNKDANDDNASVTETRGDGSNQKCTDCDIIFDTFESLKSHRTEVHQMETMVCNICYRVFGDSSQYKNHVQNHVPTMLFSGEFLEKSKMNVNSKKMTRRSANSKTGGGDSSGQEVKTPATVVKNPTSSCPQSKEESEKEASLSCGEFIRLVRSALSESSDEGVSDDEDLDSELIRGLQTLLYLSTPESGGDSEAGVCSTSGLDQKEQAGTDHQTYFDSNTIQDYANHIFKCVPCNACFGDNDALIEHMKTHICEMCQEFFVDQKMLIQHKYACEQSQVKERSNEELFDLINQHQDDESSTSENEAHDLFMDELENILDTETNLAPQIDLLHTFSHDEIVKSNKKTFELYSCVDVPTNIYACTICKRKYARPTTLTRHFKTHVCHYCNKFFIDKSDLMEHKYKHRQKAALLKAEISGEPSTKILNSPMVSKVNRELFKKFTFIDSSRNLNKCCLCDKTFVRKTVLTRHMKTHICSYCDKFYEDKYELARHVSLHKIDARVSDDGGDTREYNDFDDEKPYTTRSSLQDQMDNDEKVVTLDPTFPSSLPHFSSTFNNSGDTGHETLTFIEIPVSDACENNSSVAFGDSSEAVNSTYQIISDSIDAFKESAHESFIVDGPGCPADDANKIITISQGQIMAADGNQERLNLFECTLCGKTFFKSGHLKSHMSTHSVHKPHVCHLCGKSFVRRGALKRHEKSHDIKRCKYCDMSFSYQFELDDHMQMHESYPFYK